jgi:glycosyltransferase involved in cell wall biosynthesis
MEILYVIIVNTFKLGGAEHQAYFLARSLREDFNLDVEIWGFKPIDRLYKMCRAQGIPVRILPKLPITYSLIAWPGAAIFALYLHHYHAGVLLPFTSYPNLICGLSWHLGGANVCIWNQLDEGKGFIGRPVEKWALGQVRHFVANSPASADALKQQGITAEQIRVIYNGIELSPPHHNRMTWRQKLGINPVCFTACMVATLSHYKDHATLLRAWRKVVDKLNEPPMLLLAGRDHDASDDLKSLSKQLNLQSFVRFLGEIEDVNGLLQACDIGLYSSISEGMPNAVLEYMAAGIPILTSDLPGTRVILGDAAADCTFTPGDATELAERILLFQAQPSLKRALAESLLHRASEYFTPQNMAGQYLAYIKEIQLSSCVSSPE